MLVVEWLGGVVTVVGRCGAAGGAAEGVRATAAMLESS
jgi:hypothetical protein